ncbi:uncharacterized protein LOC141646747 [Silene latifolia]|uniref:uncharacterized protein LOC141646747 n=1 Tax=Silene latifolia TaxID=37657 RepID=UPI003D7767AA
MKKNVVVIGGGVAGALLAKLLQNDAYVTLIDPKDYLELTWASLRSMVDPSFAERSLINYTDFLPKVKLVTSLAKNITQTEVITANGDRIPYDYLVIATGHIHSDPVTRTDSLLNYQSTYDKIQSSNTILIVGGGPTGVELAGEIATQFPDKKVTLVNRGSRLLNFIGPKASQKSLEWLISKKVEVLLNQTVSLKSSSKDVYETSEGQIINADAYFNCTGKPLSSSWLDDTLLKPCLNTDRTLAVDTCLRVVGHKNVFAIGDITNVPELKQGYLAMEHATLTAKNIKLLFKGENEEKLGAYKASKPLAFVSLGKKDGVAQINGFTIHGCLVGLIKSRDLFVGKTRKSFGLQS